jgi:hypothetical protein
MSIRPSPSMSDSTYLTTDLQSLDNYDRFQSSGTVP